MKDCVGPGITKCCREGDDLGFVESDWMGTPTITVFAITDSVFPWVVLFSFFLSFFLFGFSLTLL